jgi:integrase
VPVVKLTAAAIPTLKPKDERREETYRDSVVRGLLLEVHPDGTRTFVAWGRVHGTGRAVRMKLGAWQADVFELADARRAARDALHELATGRDPVVERKRAREAGTFGDLVESFLKDAQIRESTRREWKRLLEAARLAGLRAQRTTEVTRGDLVRLFDRIRANALREGDKGYAANRTLEAVRRVFSWAVQKDLVAASPCIGVVKPTKERPRQRAYTDAELGAIVRALDESAMSDAIRLALYTGVRMAQALGAPWSESDRDKEEWLISGERTGTKNARPWLVPLTKPALDLLERRKNESPWVFPALSRRKESSDGRSWRQQRTVYMIRERSGITDFRPHDLRRTLDTWLASRAGGAQAVAVRNAILGHKPPGIDATYNVHDYAKEKRVALDWWAKHLQRLAAGEPAKVIQMPGVVAR